MEKVEAQKSKQTKIRGQKPELQKTKKEGIKRNYGKKKKDKYHLPKQYSPVPLKSALDTNTV